MTSRLGLQVRGYDPESVSNELVEDLRSSMMEYRSEKVESDSNFPATYKATLNAGGEDPESAFYNMPVSSEFRMTIQPGTGFENPQDLVSSVKLSENAVEDIEVFPEDTCEHLPVLQDAYEVLNENGYSTTTSAYAEEKGDTVEETLQDLVDNGARVEMHLGGPKTQVRLDGDNPSHPDDVLYTDLVYDADSRTIDPMIEQCVVPQEDDPQYDQNMEKINQNIDRIETEVEQLLEQEGLLK